MADAPSSIINVIMSLLCYRRKTEATNWNSNCNKRMQRYSYKHTVDMNSKFNANVTGIKFTSQRVGGGGGGEGEGFSKEICGTVRLPV